jgi:hypothetical protein
MYKCTLCGHDVYGYERCVHICGEVNDKELYYHKSSIGLTKDEH